VLDGTGALFSGCSPLPRCRKYLGCFVEVLGSCGDQEFAACARWASNRSRATPGAVSVSFWVTVDVEFTPKSSERDGELDAAEFVSQAKYGI